LARNQENVSEWGRHIYLRIVASVSYHYDWSTLRYSPLLMNGEDFFRLMLIYWLLLDQVYVVWSYIWQERDVIGCWRRRWLFYFGQKKTMSAESDVISC
jgi:hypothetical protein